LEALEPRYLLSGNPVITEFMAQNDDALQDGDGNRPDWIEIYNPSDAAVDLAGYRLSDKADNLSRWVFPHVELGPGDYLVVFASGQEAANYVDAAGNLHTNFSLRAEGEYLALVAPDGAILSQFGSGSAGYPPQRPDVSYGAAQQVTWVDARHEASYLVPLNERVDSAWTELGFDARAASFSVGHAALGYESRPESSTSFASQISTALPPRTHAVYARIEFTVPDATRVRQLTLRLKYDDGFVAYLNGGKVAQENAPTNLQWYSSALDDSRPDAKALEFVDYDLSGHLGQLVDGTNVLALHGLNALGDSDMLLVPELIAVSLDESSPVGYMTRPTPGAANGNEQELYSGFVQPVQISAGRGFFDAPFDVSISTETPGAVIRYTTDGSLPTATSGTEYAGPIHVNTTTTLRAAAFKDDYIPTAVESQTYLFLGDVIRQPNDPAGFPGIWDGIGENPIPADYEMDPQVVNDPAYRDEILDGLRSIPTMSLLMEPGDLFGAERGIYIHSGQRGDQWRKATSVEIINPDGSSFQADSGILIHGYSWRFHSNTPKHSFRLEFSQEYGPKKLEYKLFPDAPIDRFDGIVLRAQGGRAWAGLQNPEQAQYIRDAFARDTARDMGKVDGHAAFFHLYLNGLYWGLYHAVEHPNAQMAEEYFGGSDEDYDALNRRTTTNEAIDGDLERYNEMLRLADRGLTTPEAYAEMERFVDVDNLIDFFLIHQYTTNRDGPEVFQSNNQRALGSRVGDAKFRFFVWDMEYSFWNATDRINIDVNVPGSISRVYTKLRENPEFRLRYADHAHKHLFNGGALTPKAAAERWEARAQEIYTAIIAESARWGDAKRARPYTRDVEWQRERTRLLTQYFPQRTDVLIGQLRQAGLYPSVDAPVFSQHGGPIPSGFPLSMSNPGPTGTILYTVDGTDPRLPGGQIAPEARIYDGQTISLDGDVTVKARVLQDRDWSALNEASFFVVGPDSPFHLRVTEINYHPHPANLVAGLAEANVDAGEFEFVELTNVSTQPIDLSGVRLARGVEFTFPAESRLGPGQHVLVVKNQGAFESRYGAGRNIAGQFQGAGLSDSGQLLELLDRQGHRIQLVAYSDDPSWPQRADGGGSSLEVIDPLNRYDDPANWRSSLEFAGSPGWAGAGPQERISITEILTHSVPPASDMVELFNPTDAAHDITNWYVSNSSDDYFRSQIKSPVSVPAHGYATLAGAQLGIDLAWWRADELWLIEADARGKPIRFVDHVVFGPSAQGISLGPGPAGEWLPLAEPTWGRPNSGLLVGDVVISEVHYAPVDPDGERRQFKADQFEFVELYNPSDTAVDLTLWRLTGGVEMKFPSGTLIPPREALLVVPFDDADGVKASIFRVTLGIGPNVALVGPYQGVLDDQGAAVRLERPDLPPAQEPAITPYRYVDEVRYRAVEPWPTSLAGSGLSLQRLSPTRFGNSAASWTAAAASPGIVDFVLREAGDSNEDGVFNQLDIVQVLQGGKYLSSADALWAEGDWNGDGRFDQLDIVAALATGNYLTGGSSRG
jgi:hypothetical protein